MHLEWSILNELSLSIISCECKFLGANVVLWPGLNGVPMSVLKSLVHCKLNVTGVGVFLDCKISAAGSENSLVLNNDPCVCHAYMSMQVSCFCTWQSVTFVLLPHVMYSPCYVCTVCTLYIYIIFKLHRLLLGILHMYRPNCNINR